jgi:hypothetical protein
MVARTPNVLLCAGHVGIENLTTEGMCPNRDVVELRKGTGTRGEREWTGNAVQTIANAMRARGINAVATDSTYSKALFDRDWDIVLNLHLQRDRATAKAFAATPDPNHGYISAAAQARAQMWLARFINEYTVVTGIPVTEDAITDRMTDFYGNCFLSTESAEALIEMGHADLNADVLYEPGIARVTQAVSIITEEFLRADLGIEWGVAVPPPPPVVTPPPAEPFPLYSFPVIGVSDADPRAIEAAAQSYSEGRAPVGFGALLAVLAKEVNVRADVALAQAMHETGLFKFDGTDPVFSAKPEWNNYGGIKTTDSTATAKFPTMEAGVRAFLAHISYYGNPDHTAAWCNATVDPRHFGAHKGTLTIVGKYGNGIWNGGTTYAPAVARHLAQVRARVANWSPPTAPPVPVATLHDYLTQIRALLDKVDAL